MRAAWIMSLVGATAWVVRPFRVPARRFALPGALPDALLPAALRVVRFWGALAAESLRGFGRSAMYSLPRATHVGIPVPRCSTIPLTIGQRFSLQEQRRYHRCTLMECAAPASRCVMCLEHSGWVHCRSL